ncbi:Tn3 family transposase [Kribbella sp. NBC_00482]|uniref:Tn3 family transposase n=1 Tax=Kribbella sp. NBC_00482 TaxID=2975968 RepID=UPI003FA587F7
MTTGISDRLTRSSTVRSCRPRRAAGTRCGCRRLLLCLFALGTNMGIKPIVSTGEHGETEAQLRHVRRHYITRDNPTPATRAKSAPLQTASLAACGHAEIETVTTSPNAGTRTSTDDQAVTEPGQHRLYRHPGKYVTEKILSNSHHHCC